MSSKYYIDKNGKTINLEDLTLQEFRTLNFEEETFFSKEIKKRKPFSKERNLYMKNAYSKIFQIDEWKKKKYEIEREKKGNGVTDQSVNLIIKIIEELLKKQEKVTFYEAGVGKGYAIEKIKEKIRGEILGCDVFLSDNIKKIVNENNDIKIVEEDIYHNLKKIEDNSIDIFYADNVLEHILEDEYKQTCERIAKKIKKDGIAIFIIPNRYVGPSDISNYFLPIGSKAKGFHFMEQSFQEGIENFQKNNLELQYFYLRNRRGNIRYIKKGKILNFIKKTMEKYLGQIPITKIRRRIFKIMAYDIYILVKI